MAQEQTTRGGGGDDGELGSDGSAGQERREKLAEDTDDLLDEIDVDADPDATATPGSSTEYQPSAGWFDDGGLVLLTWGSSSCAPVVESVEADGVFGVSECADAFDAGGGVLEVGECFAEGCGDVTARSGDVPRGLVGGESPRRVRRLRSLGRMESCQGVHRRGIRPSCVSGRYGWSPRSGPSTSRSGPR